MKHYLQTLNDIIFRPRHFFANISHQGIKEPLKFLVFLSLFTQFFLVFAFLKSAKPISLEKYGIPLTYTPHLTFFTFVLFYVFALIAVVFYNFLRPSITHFFVKLFNRRARFKDTYKAIVYSNTPTYIILPFYLVVVALGFSAALFQKPFLLILLIISLIFWLGAEAYSIYLHIMSISRLQNISWIKSLLCVYVFPTLVFVILEVIAFGTILAVGFNSLKIMDLLRPA